MTEQEFINREISVWGEDYIFDLIDRGFTPVQLIVSGELRWWWKLEEDTTNQQSSCSVSGRSGLSANI